MIEKLRMRSRGVDMGELPIAFGRGCGRDRPGQLLGQEIAVMGQKERGRLDQQLVDGTAGPRRQQAQACVMFGRQMNRRRDCAARHGRRTIRCAVTTVNVRRSRPLARAGGDV